MANTVIALGPGRTRRTKLFAAASVAALVLAVVVGSFSALAGVGIVVFGVLPLAGMTALHAVTRATMTVDAKSLKARAPNIWGYPVAIDVPWGDLLRVSIDQDSTDDEAPISLDNPAAPAERTRERYVRVETRWRAVLLPTASFETSPEVIVRRLARCVDAGASGTRAPDEDVAQAKRRFAAQGWSTSRERSTLSLDASGISVGPAVLPWELVVAAHVIDSPKPHIEIECADGTCVAIPGDWSIPTDELAAKLAPTFYLSEDRPPVLTEPKPTALLLDL